MLQPLLTIIVPTYNRSANLAILLSSLRDETAHVANEVQVYVSDNCSTDDTPNVIAQLAKDWLSMRSYRHLTNLGAESNFIHAVDSVKTRWFWIIGDDDLPKRGVVEKVVKLLRMENPALIYMQSEWLNPVQNVDQGVPIGDFQISSLNSLQFAEAVHVWVTFISGMVVDKERLVAMLGSQSIKRFDAASRLVQLGWVLPLFNSKGPFLFISNSCMLATKDNSGGYCLLTVFGINFTRIINESFGSNHPLAQAMIGGNISQYLPGLIWGARNTRRLSSHITVSPWRELNGQLGSQWLYWLLIVPLGRLPPLLAQPFFQTWRVLNRMRREWRQIFGN